MMQDPSAQPEWSQWLDGLDLDKPLSELIDNPAWLEGLTFSQEDLTYLERLGQEYAQELVDRDAIPNLPPLDMPESLLEPDHMPEHAPDRDHDLDLDR